MKCKYKRAQLAICSALLQRTFVCVFIVLYTLRNMKVMRVETSAG